MYLQFEEFNTFLNSVVKHKSVSSLMRYFANYETVVPPREVTVDTCCFANRGSTRRLGRMVSPSITTNKEQPFGLSTRYMTIYTPILF